MPRSNHMLRNPVQQSRVDFSYLNSYGNTNTYRFPTTFEHVNYKGGETFHAQIINIYDPSKFWIVPRYRELQAYQTYLFKFYSKNREIFKIPRDKIHVNMYCVTFTDPNFYRGVIVGSPPDTLHNVEQVKVYYFDYGMIQLVPIQHLYYMNKDSFKVPQFAVRAGLACICPPNNGAWTNNHVTEFTQLVSDKILGVNVIFVDTDRQLLKIYLCEENLINPIVVHETLVLRGSAKYFTENSNWVENNSTNIKLLHLFPSHEALERGVVPSKVYQAEILSAVDPTQEN